MEYSFEYCVEKSIVLKVGCQPYWNKFDITGIQICKNGTMMQHYSDEKTRSAMMSRVELIGETKCLMPCTFMEYKVS